MLCSQGYILVTVRDVIVGAGLVPALSTMIAQESEVPYDPDQHQRRSIRLRAYDYASAGAYFVTICTQGHVARFGEIIDGEMRLNDAGRMVQTVWESIPSRFPDIASDVYVIMPNHFHAIVVINPPDAAPVGAPGGTPHVGAFSADGSNAANCGERVGTSPTPTTTVATGPALGDVIGAFKSITTREYAAAVRSRGWPRFDQRLWQRNYWEHIIRTLESRAGIAEYITGNPATWGSDRLNPEVTPKYPG